MKRFVMWLFVALCLVSASVALGDETIKEFESCKKLTNKAIIKVLKKSEYASWEFFQPSDSEIAGKNIYKEKWFKSTAWFPVVAHKDEELDLVLLHKVNNKWKIELSNSNALKKDGYFLTGFTVDADSYDEATGGANFCFSFHPASHPLDGQYDLYLKTGNDSYFSDFVYSDPEMQFFSPLYGFFLHIDKERNEATYQTLDSLKYVLQGYSIETSVERFDMSTFPICIEDYVKQEQIFSLDEDTLVYSKTNTASSVLCTIPASESVFYCQSELNWWLVIYEGKIGFVQQSQ